MSFGKIRARLIRVFLEPVLIMSLPSNMIVCGYIRANFDERCWIDEIIQTIILFFATSGGSLYTFGNTIGAIPTLCPAFFGINAMDVACSWDGKALLILDIDGDLWTHKEAKGKWIPTKVNVANRAISVSVGSSHSLILFENGWVQSFGMNTCGQLGHCNFWDESSVPETIDGLKKYKIIQISAGSIHSAALTEDGDLFCFGNNSYGQLGIGKSISHSIKSSPTKIYMHWHCRGTKKISFVACGSDHTLVITRDHLIRSFGDNSYCQLGNGFVAKHWYVRSIKTFKTLGTQITTCAAATRHSICVDMEGIVWSFGSNVDGQCGAAEYIKKQKIPTKIEWFVDNNIKAIDCAAGYRTSSVIAEDGSLYVFGNNESNQLEIRELPLPHNVSIEKLAMGYAQSAIILFE